MNLIQLSNMLESEDWDVPESSTSVTKMRRMIAGFQHEAEIMLKKLYDWQKYAPGKVYVTSTKKNAPGGTAAKIPQAVSQKPGDFINLSIIDVINNEQLITRIYVSRSDVPLVRKIRRLIDRHNDLTNKQAEIAGKLVSSNPDSTGAQ